VILGEWRFLFWNALTSVKGIVYNKNANDKRYHLNAEQQ
jgi:hypothetical protein